MRFLIFFILLSIHGHGQNAFIPFEFERQPSSYYQNSLSALDADFSNEKEALVFYLTAYKLQRASNPSDYFVAPNVERNLAREYIHAFHSGQFSIGLIAFLESEGSTDATLKLMESEAGFPEGAFYKYLCAKILKQEGIARDALIQLDKAKMISPVTKAFGINSILSADGNNMIATQGFQDMLAVDYGLMKLNKQNIRVLNYFMESLPANVTPKISLELSLDPSRIWISPAISQVFVAKYGNGLWIEGMGLHWKETDALDDLLAELKLLELADSFVGIGEKPLTPADEGLIRSYQIFANAYQLLAEANDDKKQKSKAEKLTLYIQPYLNE